MLKDRRIVFVNKQSAWLKIHNSAILKDTSCGVCPWSSQSTSQTTGMTNQIHTMFSTHPEWHFQVLTTPHIHLWVIWAYLPEIVALDGKETPGHGGWPVTKIEHIAGWFQSPWNKASDAGHIPCWCNRRATTSLLCLRDDHPREMSTPCEASNLKNNCSEALTSSTSPLHCNFQTCNDSSLITRNSKVDEVVTLLGYVVMSLGNC